MRDLLIVLGAITLVILSSAWWPAIGAWRARREREWFDRHGMREVAAGVWVDNQATDDEPDDWADELHTINQLGKFGDLTRPAKDLTHYEVEAVIRDLGVPEWVPASLLERVAA